MLDSYERRARLTPGLLAVAPVVVLLIALGLEKNVVVSATLGVLSFGVGTYLLSVIVANLGRRLQDELWKSWGGPPTSQLLRAHSNKSSISQRSIWRSAIESVTGVALLPAAQEVTEPGRADELIAAAIGQVRHLGQDRHYPLIAAENAQYGLERNLYGSRWLGRALSLACFVALAIALKVVAPLSVTLLIGTLVELVLSVLWFIIPSEGRMKDAAFRYGEQLLQAVTRESSARTTEGGTRP